MVYFSCEKKPQNNSKKAIWNQSTKTRVENHFNYVVEMSEKNRGSVISCALKNCLIRRVIVKNQIDVDWTLFKVTNMSRKNQIYLQE